MALATLTIDLVAKLANIEQDLGRLNHMVDQSAGRISNAFDGARASMQKFAGVLGVSLTGGALVAFVKSSIDAEAALYDLSQQTGASVESLSGMKIAAKLANTSLDEVGGSIKKLAIALGDARLKGGDKAKLFQALGIDPATVKDTGQALFDLSKKLVAMPDQVKAIAIARDLLGKGASMPFINELAAQEELIAKVTTQQALAAKRFQDDLIRLQQGAGTLGIALANSVLPQMNEILKFSLEVKKEWGTIAAIIFGLGGGTVLKLLGIDLDPAARAATEAADAFKRLAEARKALDQAQEAEKRSDTGIIPGLADFRRSRTEKAQAEVDAAKRNLDETIRRAQRESAKAAAESEQRNRKPAPFDVPDLALSARTAQEDAAVQAMIERLDKAKGETSEFDKVMERLTSGTWKQFGAQARENLISLSQQIDTQNRYKLELEGTGKMLEKLAANQAALDDLATASQRAQDQSLADLQFELTLIGKTTDAKARAREMRKIDLELEKEIFEIKKRLQDPNEEGGAGSNPALDREIEAARRRATEAKQQQAEVSDAILAKSRDWSTGISDGLDSYLAKVNNVAASSEALMTDAFKGMEDALVEFVKTGKLDFKSLADSIVTDLIRIQVQQGITKPIAQAMQSSGGGLLGGLKSLFGFADGGIMTSAGPLPLRKYAGGGVANSPQLAVFGEGASNEAFVPLPDGRSIPVSLRGNGQSVVIHQTVNIDSRTDQAVIMQAMVAAKNAAVAQIHDSMRRGGSFA